VSIEAGISTPWFRYVGIDGISLGVNRFGLSAPGPVVMKELGMTPEKVVEAAQSL